MSYPEIEKYLLENLIDRNQQNPYDLAALQLGVDKEIIRRAWRNLRNKGLVETSTRIGNFGPTEEKFAQISSEYKEDRLNDGSVRIQDSVDRKLSDKELFERYGRNTKEWKIISVWFKDKPNGFLLSVHFAPKKIETDLVLQKELLLKELFEKSPKISKFPYTQNQPEGKYLFEISIPDLHCGKLAWREESGEDYDLKIAQKLYKDAITELLSAVNVSTIKRILLPVGNDMVNIDNRRGETTAGTKVDSDSRYFKIVRTVKEMIISNVLALTEIAPVDIVVISGNHDYETMWLIGEMLEAYFHNNKNVTVDNSPNPRKYYRFGKNGMLYTHGNEEKHADLGLIFATERPDLWASSTVSRTAKVGHLHKNKTTNFVSVSENTGFTVQILPSLSKSDFWHKSKGYMSKQAAKGFLYDENKGLIAEYNYNV